MYEDLKRYTRWLGRWALVLYFFVALVGLMVRDDSDPSDWWRHSGLMLRTDSYTGCQYLESKNGGLTPRLDRDGLHVGCR